MSKLSGLNRRQRRSFVPNAQDPHGFGQCDGCSFWIENRAMRKRMAYRGGSTPVWDGFWVCATCDDIPNAQFARPKIYKDPYPLPHIRPGSGFTIPGSTNSDSGYGYLVDQSGNYICATPYLDYGLHPLITEIAGLPDTVWP